MAEPVIIAVPAVGGLAWIAAGAVGSASDRAFCAVLRGVKDRVAGLRGTPQNHDVARAVRTAQMRRSAPHGDLILAAVSSS
jgi:hypothetical protein